MTATPDDAAPSGEIVDQFFRDNPEFAQLRSDMRKLARTIHRAELVQFAAVVVVFLAALGAAAATFWSGWAFVATAFLAPVGWALGRANTARNRYEIKLFEAHMYVLTNRARGTEAAQE